MGRGRLDACVYICIPHILCEVGRASSRWLSPLCLSCNLHRRPHPVVKMMIHRLRLLWENIVFSDAVMGSRDAESLTIARMEIKCDDCAYIFIFNHTIFNTLHKCGFWRHVWYIATMMMRLMCVSSPRGPGRTTTTQPWLVRRALWAELPINGHV